MEEKKSIWTDHYSVGWYDTDITKSANLAAICNYLQETAWHHADHLNFGLRKGNEFEFIWALVRLMVKLEKYPGWTDTISVKTWHRGTEGLFAMRDFEILDASGNRIGCATSQWFILDPVTRRPQQAVVDREILHMTRHEPVMQEQPEKIQIAGPVEFLSTEKARFAEIDMYGHVNNTRYVEWILNAIRPQIHKQNFISGFTIEFLQETKLGNEVDIFGQGFINENPGYPEIQGQGITLLKGVRREDGQVVFRAKLHWKVREP
ncbi:MAG: thioesterase [Bacteroidetes bacterium]|nr:thioesterase [Bacteroidota bacterium]